LYTFIPALLKDWGFLGTFAANSLSTIGTKNPRNNKVYKYHAIHHHSQELVLFGFAISKYISFSVPQFVEFKVV